MSVCSVGQTWYEKHSIIHLCLESVHRDRRWLGSKTLLGRFPSHHLFSPCLLCHTLSLTFLASLSHFYRFVASPTGKLYTLECLKSAPPWAMLLLVSVKDYDVCNLTLPLNPVHSPLLSLPSLWFLWHCLLQSFLSIFFFLHLPALLKPQPRKKPLTSGASPISGLWSAVKDSGSRQRDNCVNESGSKCKIHRLTREVR